jgi:hypothetical protein
MAIAVQKWTIFDETCSIYFNSAVILEYWTRVYKKDEKNEAIDKILQGKRF